ncbi:hypothetical protein JQ615_41850 [Bradyrhizobium jicamae]|uniref:Uncharacterized protein n=1 Tax=Bradyrhizobium jicamae TaxID=280332 RepID=A0ABS5FYJ0_9BRAD|nr:hypothetical protein [Bradyrhizobium jicamae]MBR0801875.1 hypothetical protein [Bradyrhizobium jicamae]
MAEDAETLFARAEAAILAAKRLVDANEEWQDRTRCTVRRRELRALFEANGWLIIYPQDLAELPLPPYRPFPSKDDET